MFNISIASKKELKSCLGKNRWPLIPLSPCGESWRLNHSITTRDSLQDSVFHGDLKLKHVLLHSRMREQSSALVTATNNNSAIGVLFYIDYDVIVRKGCFQRGSTLNFLKNFRTFSVSILGQCHGVIISVKPISKRPRWREIYFPLYSWISFFCLFWRRA